MITSLVLTSMLALAPAAADVEAEEPGFFDTNWPTALSDDLEPEVYENRVLLWGLLSVTWLCGGQIWVPNVLLDTPAADGHTEAAVWSWCTQLVPCVICGPCGSIYIVINSLWLAPARGINLYNAYAIKARLLESEKTEEGLRNERNKKRTKSPNTKSDFELPPMRF